MKGLTIVFALALVLSSGFQLATVGAAQAGERHCRNGGEIYGLPGDFYGDRHARDSQHKNHRRFERRHDRWHYGFVRRHHQNRHYAYYNPHRNWHRGHAGWYRQERTRDTGSYAYRY